MNESIEYLRSLYVNTHWEVYEYLLYTFCIFAIIIWRIKGLKNGHCLIVKVLLAEYVFLIFGLTIFFRLARETHSPILIPFWSYKAILEGEVELIAESILNIVVFVPLGFLIGIAYKKMNWWSALLFCMVISVSIETLQFFLKRGLTEIDDVIHNVLGFMIGYGSYSLIRYGYDRIRKRNVAIL